MSSPAPSRIFDYRRVLGFVSNHVPFAVRYIPKTTEHVIYTVVGNSFHTYGSSKLRLLSVSKPHPDDINCIVCGNIFVFTACQNVIRAWRRGIEVLFTYTGHESTVHLMLLFGPYLISVDKNSCLKMWHIKKEELYLELDFDNDSFCITTILHPSTYLNKILLGSKQGRLQLWNVNTSKLIHTFKGWNSSVLVTEQAPAVDVVAIGLASGRIILHNLKYDETVIEFSQEFGSVTGISFRLDGQPIMAAATSSGDVILWDLEKKQLSGQIRKAHYRAVTGIQFFSNEPVLITSSPDNSLKMWLFDLPDGSGRMLKFREGHHAPPSKIRFYDNEGYILSAGQDSTLRMFSVVADILHKSLGQASFNRSKAIRKGVKNDLLKMPAITDFSFEITRQKEWDNVACCHENLAKVTTWSTHLSKMGLHKLHNERFRKVSEFKSATATCSCISICGNFVLIGFDSGHADMYNIQSGLFRGQYGDPKAHKKSIRGIVTDNLNRVTMTGSSDSTVKFWNFKTKQLLHCLDLTAGVAKLSVHRESGLVAIVLDDFTINILDSRTKNIVRMFSGYMNRITDVAFSPDSRWLISSSMDCSIRTWDIPTAQLIDHFLVESPCTSLDISPSGEYLATTHVDDLGIYLWTNGTIYRYINLRPLPTDYEPILLKLSDSNIEEDEVEHEAMDVDETQFKTSAQISDELVTLSLLPHSRWHNLLVLDIIKAKNKPKEPVQKPKQAPFFLPTVAGLDVQFAIDKKTEKNVDRRANLNAFQSYSKFAQQLASAENKDDFDAALSTLKEMGPAQIDAELRCLAPDNGGSIELLQQFLQMIFLVLETNKDFEVAQAFLAIFLKLHWSTLSSDLSAHDSLKSLENTQKVSWERLQTEFNQCLCLVNFFKNSHL